MHEIDLLAGSYDSATFIKNEVGVLCATTNSNSYKNCDHYEVFSGHNCDSGQ